MDDLNDFPTKGWSCARVRDTVLKYIRESPGVTAEMISKIERCPLASVQRAIRTLAAKGLIKPFV